MGIIQKVVDLLVHIEGGVASGNLCHGKFLPINNTGIKKAGWNADDILYIPVEQFFLHDGSIIR